MRQVLLYLLAMWKSALCSHKYRTMSSRPCGSDWSSKTGVFNKNLKAGGPERSRVGLGDMVDISAMADEGRHNAEVPSSCGTPECCHYRHSSPSPTPSTTPTPSSSPITCSTPKRSGSLDDVSIELHHALGLAVGAVLRQQGFHHLQIKGLILVLETKADWLRMKMFNDL